MYGCRLIERTLQGAGRAAVRPDPATVLQDVLDHLRQLFNVRQGALPIRPDYGMPDINGLIDRFPDAIEVLRESIAEQIGRFEPRLELLSVRHEPDPQNPLTLDFSIRARLVTEDARVPVVFATAIHDDGAVTLSA
jgi:type VI secretion system protein